MTRESLNKPEDGRRVMEKVHAQVFVDTHQLSCKCISWIYIIIHQCSGDHCFNPILWRQEWASMTTPVQILWVTNLRTHSLYRRSHVRYHLGSTYLCIVNAKMSRHGVLHVLAQCVKVEVKCCTACPWRQKGLKVWNRKEEAQDS